MDRVRAEAARIKATMLKERESYNSFKGTFSAPTTLPIGPQSSLIEAPTKPITTPDSELESPNEEKPNYKDLWPKEYAPKWIPGPYTATTELLPPRLNTLISTYESSLKSFTSHPHFEWPHTWPHFSPQLLARAGFAYDPTYVLQDCIYCPCCELELKLLMPDLNVWERHMQEDESDCKWVHNENHPFACRRCPERFASNTKLHAHVQKHHSKQAKAKSNTVVWDQGNSHDHKLTPKLGKSSWKKNIESFSLPITPSASPTAVPSIPSVMSTSIPSTPAPHTPPISSESCFSGIHEPTPNLGRTSGVRERESSISPKSLLATSAFQVANVTSATSPVALQGMPLTPPASPRSEPISPIALPKPILPIRVPPTPPASPITQAALTTEGLYGFPIAYTNSLTEFRSKIADPLMSP